MDDMTCVLTSNTLKKFNVLIIDMFLQIVDYNYII